MSDRIPLNSEHPEPKFGYEKGRVKIKCPCGHRLGMKYEKGAKVQCRCNIAYSVDVRPVMRDEYYLVTSYPPKGDAQ